MTKEQNPAPAPATIQSTKRIIRLDASALVQSSCMHRLKLLTVDGYRDKEEYNDVRYGSAFHMFVKEMHLTGGNFAEAIGKITDYFSKPCTIRPRKGHLDLHHLQKTCIDFWTYHMSKDDAEVIMIDGKPLVEIPFDIPYMEYDDVVFHLTGTIDKLVKIKNGCYAVGDYKTHSLFSVSKTSNPSFEMDAYLNKFEMSTQLRFYIFVLKLLARQNKDSIFAKVFNGALGAFIDGVFLSSKEPTQFRRSTVWMDFANEKSLDEVDLILKNKITMLAARLEDSSLDRRDGIMQGSCVEQQWPCKFWQVCATNDDTLRDVILKNNFAQKEYNPLMFGKDEEKK